MFSRMKGQDIRPQMTFGPWTFSRKCPWTYQGHVPDMSYVLKCVLKFSRGQDGSLPTKKLIKAIYHTRQKFIFKGGHVVIFTEAIANSNDLVNPFIIMFDSNFAPKAKLSILITTKLCMNYFRTQIIFKVLIFYKFITELTALNTMGLFWLIFIKVKK